MPDDQGELIVSPDKLDSFLVVFGIEVDDEGHLVKIETGEELKSAKGNEITTDEIGYLGSAGKGLAIIPDNYSEIVAFLSNHQEYEIECSYNIEVPEMEIE